MGIRKILDDLEPHFTEGGKYQKMYPLYEAIDTFFYQPNSVTRTTSHVRDGMDLKRIMITVWLCTFPVMFFGMWNIGYQANTAIADGLTMGAGWREWFISLLAGNNPSSIWDNFWYGFWHFMPIYAVTFAVGIAWEILFATVRKHEVNEGFFVTSVLFALICPPDMPLWQIAVGISFGVVVGKEVFGGTGKNFLNPALTGRAFLYFAYPASMSGNEVWTAVDGFTGATALSLAQDSGVAGMVEGGVTWSAAFLGTIQGSI
ncbi:MAG: RnfABCDGE type electron transport complex subunit D, partial [Natronospirillum sp.]